MSLVDDLESLQVELWVGMTADPLFSGYYQCCCYCQALARNEGFKMIGMSSTVATLEMDLLRSISLTVHLESIRARLHRKTRWFAPNSFYGVRSRKFTSYYADKVQPEQIHLSYFSPPGREEYATNKTERDQTPLPPRSIAQHSPLTLLPSLFHLRSTIMLITKDQLFGRFDFP